MTSIELNFYIIIFFGLSHTFASINDYTQYIKKYIYIIFTVNLEKS